MTSRLYTLAYVLAGLAILAAAAAIEAIGGW